MSYIHKLLFNQYHKTQTGMLFAEVAQKIECELGQIEEVSTATHKRIKMKTNKNHIHLHCLSVLLPDRERHTVRRIQINHRINSRLVCAQFMQWVAQANRRNWIFHSESEELSCPTYHRRSHRTTPERLWAIADNYRTTHLFAIVARVERLHSLGKRMFAHGSLHGCIVQIADTALCVFGQHYKTFHRTT